MKPLKRIVTVALFISLAICAKSQKQDSLSLQIFGKNGIPKCIIFKQTPNLFLKGQEKQVFKEYLKTTKDDELKLLEIQKDELGFSHLSYLQFYKGIPVEFSAYYVHCKNDTIETMNGHFSRITNIDISPKISKEVALDKAKAYVGAKVYMWDLPEAERWIKNEKNNITATFFPLGKLVIVEDRLGNSGMRLAFKFEIYAYEPNSRRNIYVDAISGAIINDEPLILDYDTPNANTRYSGPRFINTSLVNGKYRLLDNTRGSGIEVKNLKNGLNILDAVLFEDLDNKWIEWHNAQKDDAALDALWGAEMFYDYFKIKYGRNSYDGNGAKINVYVHFGIEDNNASWASDHLLIGDGIYQYNPFASIDLIGHELGHGIDESTSDLAVDDEAGAMKEALGDIWGACVEYFAAPEKDTWTMGQDIQTAGKRSMKDPKSFGDPEKYLGPNWISDPANEEFTHTNCTVMDHWFYLLSTSIGIENAAKIVYTLETSRYIHGDNNFSDARLASLNVAKLKFGFNSNQVIQTGKSWYLVDVGGIDYMPVLPNTQITGGGSNTVPYRRSTTYFVTPASDNYTYSYTWSIVPYSMGCSSDKLPYFVSNTNGTQVIINSGSCSGQYIIRCRANNPWCSSYYQDRVITVSNGVLVSDPDPCAPTINVYPNPTKESEVTTLQIQYPCIEEINSMNTDNQYELSIYDINGTLVLKQDFNSEIYSFGSQYLKKNNNYILILKDKKGNLCQKHLKIE